LVKSGTSFLLGVVVGIGAGVLIKRIRIIVEEDKPDRVIRQLNDSLLELEERARKLETRFSST
jgi:uncharacterized membrane-anchored protein YhcB (DUF1043 family)